MSENWQCLESNPEALDKYLLKLDFNTEEYCFYDLFSTEDWAKENIPKPVLGVLLIFPTNEKTYSFKKQEYEEIVQKGQFVSEDLFFVKQFALNSCGTMAVYHLLTNLEGENKKLIKETSIIHKFIEENHKKSVEERSKAFNESKDIKNNHSEAVQSGTTNDYENSNNHFVCFIKYSGVLYEMDGLKEFPINHGPTSENDFLDNACEQIKKFMERDPDNVNFSIICLAKKKNEED